jgi:hypothetical protein
MIRHFTFILSLILIISPRSLFSQPIDIRTVSDYLRQVQQIVRTDAGRFWGTSLEGPILLVEPQSRTIVANQSDAGGFLTRNGTVYTGILPGNIPISNTAIDWSGTRWAMIVWPVSDHGQLRNVLLVHELWHRIQDQLGFPPTDPFNDHLGSRDGRTWIRLEMRALLNALNTYGQERRQSLEDALAFRLKRYALFPSSRINEQGLELHEGLAEYTGISVGIPSRDDRMRYMIQRLRQSENDVSYVRSFAYYTLPAYGLLLDEVGRGWHRSIKRNSDIDKIVMRSFGISVPNLQDSNLIQRAHRYGVEQLIEAEKVRAERSDIETADFLRRFVQSSRLIVPLEERKITFDPRMVTPLRNHGRVYKVFNAIDVWGALSATNGVLMSNDWSTLYLEAPTEIRGGTVRGNGYTLNLSEGWKIRRDDRSGDYFLER